ncbi:ATP-grasp domain-containing protein [Butyrivibrio sp. INlla16]|uniref:ATP-binding protein n=1 Tax=Butyrivibrio sp. INlla16 TaxID=1520807 RepID=UPI000882AB8A|nr:ATP-grasp domain-containing protein [Butyrivibrio sp. INlla16]SDB68553.1 Carbamoylphosphate synthase large subunit [Butyrivibrio sp. INlla16]
MEKLLFLGNNCHVDEMIKHAKERGVYTIVTDNLPVEKSPEKGMADEAWDISVVDIDALEKKCREEGVTAVLAGAGETCIEANKELCKRLGLHFYAEDETLAIVNDKTEFKKVCAECGMEVPMDYKLDIELKKEDIKKIKYPVVVKPVDGCSSIGLHICYNEQELIEGYKDAYEKSDKHKVVVEEYIEGELAGYIVVVKNGVCELAGCGDDVKEYRNGQRRVFGFLPSKHIKLFENYKPNIDKMLTKIGCKEGICGLQFLTDSKRFAIIEMNYRLPGGKYPFEDLLCNTMLDTVLEEKKNQPCNAKAAMQMYSYAFWLNPGTIKEIKGIDKIKEQIPGIQIQQVKQVGHVVEPDTAMRMIFGFILFSCKSEDYDKCLNIINSNLEVISESGESMTCPFEYSRKGYAVKVGDVESVGLAV